MPQVLQRPFAVQIRRITQEEIDLHTQWTVITSTKTCKTKTTSLTIKQCVVRLDRLLPRDILDFNVIQTKFWTKRIDSSAPPDSTLPHLASSSVLPRITEKPKSHFKPNVVKIKKVVGKPDKAPTRATKAKPNYRHVFTLRRHVLRKHRTKMYLKCRVRRCPMAYDTFSSVCSLTAHHRLHHPSNLPMPSMQ